MRKFIHSLSWPAINEEDIYFTGGMKNLYSFIQVSLEPPFSEFSFSHASLWHQYTFNPVNISRANFYNFV